MLSSAGSVTSNCPSDYKPVGGGYSTSSTLNVLQSSRSGLGVGNGWTVVATNTSPTDQTLFTYVECVRVLPWPRALLSFSASCLYLFGIVIFVIYGSNSAFPGLDRAVSGLCPSGLVSSPRWIFTISRVFIAKGNKFLNDAE